MVKNVSLWTPIVAAARVSIPDSHKLPIAIVGAGGIVDGAHLPAYAKENLEIVGIYDTDGARASDVARRHGIPRVYADLAELLSDDAVKVIDVAVPAAHQPDIVRAAIAAGKDMLCQKPFAERVSVAKELSDLARREGVRIVVNQQMRYDEGIAAAKAIIDAGWIGTVTNIYFEVDIRTSFELWPWVLTAPRFDLAFHSIHYLDTIRALVGDPSRVFCATNRRPGQAIVAETRTLQTLLFDTGVTAGLHVNHENLAGDDKAEFRIDGSLGTIRGTLGLFYDLPTGRPDTVELHSTVVPTDGWYSYPVTRKWFCDAFLGPMADLLRWIATHRVAPTNVRDNLGTLALIEALYDSAASGQAQPVAW
jgi:predicted dehydrogenase